MILSLEDENTGAKETTLASSMHPVSTSLKAPGASEVEPEPYQTKTRDDVIFIG